MPLDVAQYLLRPPSVIKLQVGEHQLLNDDFLIERQTSTIQRLHHHFATIEPLEFRGDVPVDGTQADDRSIGWVLAVLKCSSILTAQNASCPYSFVSWRLCNPLPPPTCNASCVCMYGSHDSRHWEPLRVDGESQPDVGTGESGPDVRASVVLRFDELPNQPRIVAGPSADGKLLLYLVIPHPGSIVEPFVVLSIP